MSTRWRVFVVVAMTMLMTGVTHAQQATDLPAVYDGVGVEERLGETVPVHMVFANAAGDSVRISDLVPDGQPVMLNFVYHTCPMLCSLMLDQLVEGLRGLDRPPGEDFQIVTVSMAGFETADLARRQKDRYVGRLDVPRAAEGWHFLTGSEANVMRLAQSVGFGYRWIDETRDFAHPAVLIFLSGNGTVTRYIHGMSYPPSDLNMALREASSGSVASVFQRLVLYCYQYDPGTNSYVIHATNLMKLAGLGTVAVLAFLLLFLWRRESVESRIHPVQG